MKKYIIAVLAAAASLMMLTGCSTIDGYALPAARIVENQPAHTIETITARGVVESVRSRNIYSALGLNIERIYIEAGDEVLAGQVLAVLDSENLELAISAQRAALNLARTNAMLSRQDTERMLNDASANLANNTNIHILNAEAALSAAEQNLASARRLYNTALDISSNMHILNAEAALNGAQSALAAIQQDLNDAARDRDNNSNPHILAARSGLETANVELETAEATYGNLRVLYAANIIPRDDMRQAENGLTHARNRRNDAQIGLDVAIEAERRTIERLETTFRSADTTYKDARTILNAARIAAERDIERLRGDIERFTVDVNVAQGMLTAARAAAAQEMALLHSNVSAAEAAANLEHLEIAIKQMELQLDDTIITAPIAGTATAVIPTEGTPATGLMFTIEDAQNLRIVTAVREYDFDKIAVGMEAIVISDATGNTRHAGTISRISPAANPFAPVVEFEVEISIPSDTGLRIGMNVRIEIAID